MTGFTIITPVAYYGQTETEPFVYASVLLDGSDGTLGGQDIIGIPHDEVRSGLRVRAVWKPKDERNADGVSNRGWGGVGSAIYGVRADGRARHAARASSRSTSSDGREPTGHRRCRVARRRRRCAARVRE